MRLDRLYLERFRCFHQFYTDFHPETNLIYGENAQGKTTLLEAMVCLSQGKSFRSQRERELIQLQENYAIIQGNIWSNQREYRLKTQYQEKKAKKMTRNDVPCQNQRDFSSVFYTVLFCPEDLSLVKGSPQLRREFLDDAISPLRPKYAEVMKEFRRLYSHKSKILREQTPNMMASLPEFNYRLAQVGAMIVHYRAHFIKRLQQAVPPIHRDFSGNREELTMEYKTVSTITDPLAGEQALFQQILAHQELRYVAELSSGSVLSGPHKDDLHFFLNGLLCREYASQGQTRTLALSLKLGQRDIVHQETGEHPVLLLDDVLSELDLRRQEFVLNRIQHGQTFITCCQKEGLLGLKEGGLFGISQGELISL